jgi:hypothetical protein
LQLFYFLTRIIPEVYAVVFLLKDHPFCNENMALSEGWSEGDSLVIFYCLSAKAISHDKCA